MSPARLLDIPDPDSDLSVQSRFQIYCDGKPLSEEEADIVAMYRLLPASHQEEIFDLIYFKYKRHVEGKKESIYSTYSDSNEEQKSAPDDDDNTPA